MTFTQIPGTKFFSLDDANPSGPQLFLYLNTDVTTPGIEFNNAFLESAAKWILCVIKGPGDISSINPLELDRRFVAVTTTGIVLWLDNFASANDKKYMERSKRLRMKSSNVQGSQLHPLTDPQNRSAFNVKLEDLKDAKVIIDGTRLRFSTLVTAYFSVNGQRAYLDDLYVDLDPSSPLKGSLQLAAEFKTRDSSFFNPQVYFLDDPGQPGADDTSIIAANLFDQADLPKTLLKGSYYPFEEIYDSGTKTYFSEFTLSKTAIRTNFMDDKGHPYILDPTASTTLKFVLGRIIDTRSDGGVSRADNPGWDRFVMRPLGTMVLRRDGSAALVAGSSGTETFSHQPALQGEIRIEFTDSDRVVANWKEIGLNPHHDKTMTSLALVNGITFNVDSEGAPSFPNGAANQGRIGYKPVKISPPAEAIPLLPTFTLRQAGTDAERAPAGRRRKLDDMFRKMRMNVAKRSLAALATSGSFDNEHITPQGFTKTSSRYEFIKAGSQFRFSLDSVDFSIENSLRTDEVFCVLTPSLLRSYHLRGGTARLDAIFAINTGQRGEATFEVNLSDLFPGIGPERPEYSSKDCIVIFKFHRQSLKELIEDTQSWTNADLLNIRDELEAAKKGIKDAIGFKEEYFSKILNDPGWNGVVVLNIPALSKGTPDIFRGAGGSQNLFKGAPADSDILNLETEFKFQYAAFPVNKTKLNGGTIEIESTSFYGMIDYAPFKNSNDYKQIVNHFNKTVDDNSEFKFVLSKLKVIFANSSIRSFESYAFLQVPKIFEDNVKFSKLALRHPSGDEPPAGTNAEERVNLIRLDGSYQKDASGEGKIAFSVNSNLNIEFSENNLIESLTIKSIGFGLSEKTGGNNKFRFDLDANVNFSKALEGAGNLFSFDRLDLQNIGFEFDLSGISIPLPKLDLSRLLVLPDINFDGKGLLNSFPIRFSHFKSFRFKKLNDIEFEFDPDFDFLAFKKPPYLRLPNIPIGDIRNLFSFIFDFDLGTLGDLGGLKALKGQLLIGWSPKGGFAIALKFGGISNQSLHIDLFGALKIDIENLDLCQVNGTFIIRMIDARLTVFGLKMPDDNDQVNAIIFAKPGSSTAWLMAYGRKVPNSNPPKLTTILGVGQRVGPESPGQFTTVAEAVEETMKVFDPKLSVCGGNKLPSVYQPQRNWLVASDSVLPDDLPIELSFIFNDPVLYGIHLGFKGSFLKGLSFDILYKKLSDNIGVYSIELQLPDAIRSYDVGGAYFRLPNLGIDVYTNGDWKGDLGFPRGSDWARSGFLQLRTVPPFVGWFGFYLMRSKIASLTLFNGYIGDEYSQKKLSIIQAGFALRVGVGAYIDGGVFYVGASISIYGILEGAFAFKRDENGLAQFFPDHVAVLGRVGAIAELVGYVNFVIIQASIYISLRAEFGMKFVVLSTSGGAFYLRDPQLGDIEDNRVYFNPLNKGQSTGLQPVKLYVEGQVVVQVCIKIGCIKIRLGFSMFIRFEFTIGGNGGSAAALQAPHALMLNAAAQSVSVINVSVAGIGAVPMIYLPAFTRSSDAAAGKLLLIHTFMIPFFGTKRTDGVIKFPENNIIVGKILQPFFTALLTELSKPTNRIMNPTSYNTLRSVLLTGKCLNTQNKSVDVKIRIPNYQPTFINGINTDQENEIREILTKQFGFSENETLQPCRDGKCQIVERYRDDDPEKSCLYVIPAPIVSKISVVDVNNVSLFSTDASGFTIDIAGLVNENVTTKIEAIRKPQTQLDKLEEHFDSYKTQFFERRANNGDFGVAALDPDLRENVIVPEFFKLFALVALETFYSGHPVRKSKDATELPTITAATSNGIFHFKNKTDDLDWNPSGKEMESIIGQLNYFYNSGLRLPVSPEVSNSPSSAIFSQLKQSVEVTPLATAPGDRVPASVSVKFRKGAAPAATEIPITRDVFMDDQATVDMWTFIDHYKDHFTAGNLANEFYSVNPDGSESANEKISFLEPYDLAEVKLTLQDGEREVMDSNPKVKFFNLPGRLLSEGELDSRYQWELNFASFADDNVILSTIPDNTLGRRQLAGVSYCLNIDLRVKSHPYKPNPMAQAVSCRALEIVNVRVEDLNLVTALRHIASGLTFQPLEIFFKPENNGVVEAVAAGGFSIIKTNLSPRTNPPLIDTNTAFAAMAVANETYIADSSDSLNFIRLLWESLSTNDGGYYLVFDNDLPATDLTKKSGQQTISLSFSIRTSRLTGIPAFFNTLKVIDTEDAAEGRSLLALIHDKKHYLYMDRISEIRGLDENSQKISRVCEYHPRMPVHSFGFKLLRDRSRNPDHDSAHKIYAPYLNYLPMEFSITDKDTGGAILSNDKILPIMPVSPAVIPQGVDPEDLMEYRHVSPLTIKSRLADQNNQLDENNIERYVAIGKEYEVSVALRDTFGFRSGSGIGKRSFKQLYNDKLIGLDAWPLCRFSYWAKKPAGRDAFPDTVQFLLTGQLNILEIQDLAGIKRREVSGSPYQYEYGDSVTQRDDFDKLFAIIPGVLQTLFTVLAQLRDKRLKVITQSESSTFKNNLKGAVQKLAFALERMQKEAESNERYTFPDEPVAPNLEEIYTYKLSADEIKKPIDISVTLLRDSSLSLPPTEAWENKTVWDFEATKMSRTVIKAVNATESKSAVLQDLDAVIRLITGPTPRRDKAQVRARYCLGISADEKNRKVIYLINELALSKLKATDVEGNRFNQQKCYFGILPFSRNLWSGVYSAPGVPTTPLSNIDLDKSLKIVLEKIDALLGASAVSSNLTGATARDLYQKLIACKKHLAKQKLSQQLASTAGLPVQPPTGAMLSKEFGELLLNDLGNFYAFDGLVKSKLTGYTLPAGHRLSIALDNNYRKLDDDTVITDYQFVSSKISAGDQDWLILFDHAGGATGEVNFTIKPRITHIEIVRGNGDDSEVEESEWIQLISPVIPDGVSSATMAEYVVKDWPGILREFPARPTITNHEATQDTPDKGDAAVTWSPSLAIWNYHLQVLANGSDDKHLYVDGDKMYVRLWKEKPAVPNPDGLVAFSSGSDEKEFQALVAYWASVIAPAGTSVTAFDWTVFTGDLYRVLFSGAFALMANGQELQEIGSLKMKRNGLKWIVEDQSGLDGKLEDYYSEAGGFINISVNGFDVFKKDGIRSLKASVRVTRNEEIQNEEFHYTTEEIFAAEVVTPSIRFFTPIKMSGRFKQNIFDRIDGLPHKATAKYLIDLDDRFLSPGNFASSLVPIELTESIGAIGQPDDVFTGYHDKNGYSAFSLTVYNIRDVFETQLPMFHAANIVKVGNSGPASALMGTLRGGAHGKKKNKKKEKPKPKKKSSSARRKKVVVKKKRTPGKQKVRKRK